MDEKFQWISTGVYLVNGSRLPIITVDIVYDPPVAACELYEHSFLILNTGTVIVLKQLIPILLRKPAVNCNLHVYSSLLWWFHLYYTEWDEKLQHKIIDWLSAVQYD